MYQGPKLAQCAGSIGGAMGYVGAESATRQPEVPALLEQLARELAEAETSFYDLRDRLGKLTRKDDAGAPNANQIKDQSGPMTELGAIIRGLVNRVDALSLDIRSVNVRLEV